MQIRFDQGPGGKAARFARPGRVISADSIDAVPAALAALDQASRDGCWIAGYASYELGYALEPRLTHRLPKDRRLPLLHFGIYDAPQAAEPVTGQGAIADIEPRWDAPRYSEAFQTVHDYISAGDIYQANLTFPIDARATRDARGLYAQLSRLQAVGYGALIEQDGLPAILSRSPELFFRTDATGQIETRPMKGTMPRDDDPVEDMRLKAFLGADAKNRAENLMIVDLLRNDISRLAEFGSVRVPELFHVESYATVHQMVSTVQAQLHKNTGLGAILGALFPCGSITGAPKLRAMEILNDLEPWARDIYCGAIGWWGPDGQSEFNVAIRTALLEGDRLTLNVGGGVVYDSTAASEYEEALWKARFATMLPRI
jgi:para-aminobenzoate synthetase component I